nr:carboxypeptidase regulatory-like domain-containing protein [Blastocatellia bacterium]
GSVDPTCIGWISVRGLSVTDQSGKQVPITVTGLPNQTVVLAGGVTITFNEQSLAAEGITVNAMRINIGGFNAVIASARSTIMCGTGGPTSAEVAVSGRTLMRSGRSAGGVTLTLTSSAGNQYTATSDGSGSFTFAAVIAGDTYVLQATHPNLTFPSQVLDVSDEISGLVIRAN